jgi:O-antigen/teichoic acid export membrane protein
LLIADLVSLAAGFWLFRTLCSHWSAEVFGRWEWWRILLGICLLLPRNGLDILAQRCSVRHRVHIREWTAIILLVRVPFAVLGAISYLALVGASNQAVMLLAMSLPIQAIVPDLAARVQGRFLWNASLNAIRNLIPAGFTILSPPNSLTPERMATAIVASESIVAALWWMDAWRYRGLPGGDWRKLCRSGWRSIVIRSFEQTIVRWMRVISWQADAIVFATLSPEFWTRLAPARALFMTAVFPVANYLGAVGPLLARETSGAIGRRFLRSSIMAIVMGLFAVFLTITFAEKIRTIVFGMDSTMDGETWALTILRFAPLVIVLCTTAFLTALRRDQLSLAVTAFDLGLKFIVPILGFSIASAHFAYIALISMEWVIALAFIYVFAARMQSQGGAVLRSRACVFVGRYAASGAYAAAVRFRSSRKGSIEIGSRSQ